jgi:TRAP-type C4-dicarboxylate transport system permease small subunit
MDPQAPNASARPRYGVLFYIGASGLMLAMIFEAIAVLGRQFGVPLLGALEIIQAAILLTASASMLSATLAGAHATVHLLVERLSPAAQSVLRRAALAISSAFFGCLAIAAAWLTIEAWNDFEHSELLHIPYRPLRVIVVVMTAAVAVVFAYKAMQRAAKERTK